MSGKRPAANGKIMQQMMAMQSMQAMQMQMAMQQMQFNGSNPMISVLAGGQRQARASSQGSRQRALADACSPDAPSQGRAQSVPPVAAESHSPDNSVAPSAPSAPTFPNPFGSPFGMMPGFVTPTSLSFMGMGDDEDEASLDGDVEVEEGDDDEDESGDAGGDAALALQQRVAPRTPGVRKESQKAVKALARKKKHSKSTNSKKDKVGPKIGGGKVGLDRYLIHCDACVKTMEALLESLELSGKSDWTAKLKDELDKSKGNCEDRAKSLEKKKGDPDIFALCGKLEVGEVVCGAYSEIYSIMVPYLNSGVAGNTLENFTVVVSEMDSQPLVKYLWDKCKHMPCFLRQNVEELTVDFSCRNDDEPGVLRHVQVATSADKARLIAPDYIVARLPERLPQYCEQPEKKQDKLKSFWLVDKVQLRMFAYCIRAVMVHIADFDKMRKLYITWFKASFSQLESAEKALCGVDGPVAKRRCIAGSGDCTQLPAGSGAAAAAPLADNPDSESDVDDADLMGMDLGAFDCDDEDLAPVTAGAEQAAAVVPKRQFETDDSKQQVGQFLAVIFPAFFEQAHVEDGIGVAGQAPDLCTNAIINSVKGKGCDHFQNALTLAQGLIAKRIKWNVNYTDNHKVRRAFLVFATQTGRVDKQFQSEPFRNYSVAAIAAATQWCGNTCNRFQAVKEIHEWLDGVKTVYLVHQNILSPQHATEISQLGVRVHEAMAQSFAILRRLACGSLPVSLSLNKGGSEAVAAAKSLFTNQMDVIVQLAGLFTDDEMKMITQAKDFLIRMLELGYNHYHFMELKKAIDTGKTPDSADQELFRATTVKYGCPRTRYQSLARLEPLVFRKVISKDVFFLRA